VVSADAPPAAQRALRQSPDGSAFPFVKTIHRYFYIFVEFFLTFPFAPIKIVCGMVYAAAVWAAQAFHDNRQMPGFTRQIGRSFSSAVRLMAFLAFFSAKTGGFLPIKLHKAIFRGHPFSLCQF
jgi:hypothetical protein